MSSVKNGKKLEDNLYKFDQNWEDRKVCELIRSNQPALQQTSIELRDYVTFQNITIIKLWYFKWFSSARRWHKDHTTHKSHLIYNFHRFVRLIRYLNFGKNSNFQGES